MKNKNITINNSIHFKKKKNISKNISHNYSNIFAEVSNDLNDVKKTINVLNKNFRFNFKFSDLQKFKKFKKVAIVGMGGSVLGIEAIFYFLKKRIRKKVYFFDDIKDDQITLLKKNEDVSKVLFIIISKSGDTIETIANSFAMNIIKNNAKNIIIISEKKNSLLFNLSKKFNLFFIEHKRDIGGRYSVLSEVGVVPAYLIGINIFKLRSAILEYFKTKNKKFLKESTTILSSYLNSKKFNNLIFLNYSPELEKFLFWYQQLIAESLGKKGKGFLPLISNAPKDHHSLLQLYLDGPKDKIFNIFYIDLKSKYTIRINKFLDKKHFLENKRLNVVKESQKNALIKSLLKNKIPFREIKVKSLSEEALGSLFSLFIIETILIAKLSKIDPFNQPAVEQVKNNTKNLLNQKNQK